MCEVCMSVAEENLTVFSQMIFSCEGDRLA